MDLYDELIRKRYLEAKEKQAAEAAKKLETGLEQSRELSPAERLLPGRSEEMREARNRKPEPDKAPEPTPQVAERMKPAPDRSQRPPSPGGSNYVNPLAYRPAAQQAAENPEPIKQVGREALIDQVNRELRESYKAQTQEDRDREKRQREERDRRGNSTQGRTL